LVRRREELRFRDVVGRGFGDPVLELAEIVGRHVDGAAYARDRDREDQPSQRPIALQVSMHHVSWLRLSPGNGSFIGRSGAWLSARNITKKKRPAYPSGTIASNNPATGRIQSSGMIRRYKSSQWPSRRMMHTAARTASRRLVARGRRTTKGTSQFTIR